MVFKMKGFSGYNDPKKNDFTSKSDNTRVKTTNIIKSKEQLDKERKEKEEKEAYIKSQAMKPRKSPIKKKGCGTCAGKIMKCTCM